MTIYLRIFNFLVRRVVAPAFVVGGVVIAVANVGAVFPGGTIGVNGVPSTDLVFRWSAVVLPLVVAALGVALYRVAPFTRVNSNVMRTIKKITGALVGFAIAAATLHWVLGEAIVRFEMWSTGATSRADLANDFGLGLLGLFVVLPGSFIGARIAAWWVWRKLSVRESTNERIA